MKNYEICGKSRKGANFAAANLPFRPKKKKKKKKNKHNDVLIPVASGVLKAMGLLNLHATYSAENSAYLPRWKFLCQIITLFILLQAGQIHLIYALALFS